MEKLEWHNERRKVRDLIPFEGNPRMLTESQKKQIQQSLSKFNLVEIPAINTDNKIIAGHQRVKILALMGRGEEEIDVRVPNRLLDENEFQEYCVRSNRNVGSWDLDLLANFDDLMLQDIGFESNELDRIFKLRDNANDDDVPAVPVEPKAKLGEIYRLGQNRIMCGDSTKPEDVARLMAGAQGSLVFTDPPYNVNYSGRGEETSNKIENDNMDADSFREFLKAAFRNYHAVMKDTAALYCCYASRTHREFEDSLNAAGFEVRNQIIWVKIVASMGWGDYRRKHEPMFYCHKKGGSLEFYGDRSQYTEWTEEKTDEELLKMMKAMICKEENGNSTVWRFNRDTGYRHPTQKPVDLVTKAIVNSSKRGDIVLDLFMGGGSTLIAAEKTSRIAYGMELDPKYIDVIIDRWEKHTEMKAERISP